MEIKPISFRKTTDKFELPDLPVSFLEKANKLGDFLNSEQNLIIKLEAVYRLMDEMAPFIATFASCSKGCSHCCTFDVHLTTFEAEYIYLKSGVPHTNEGKITKGHNTPCPFLKATGECGIYNVRPLLCRTYHALGDPALCADRNANQIQYGSPAANFGNKIYAQLVGWVHFQTAHVGGELKDIRDFFPYTRNSAQKSLANK